MKVTQGNGTETHKERKVQKDLERFHQLKSVSNYKTSLSLSVN